MGSRVSCPQNCLKLYVHADEFYNNFHTKINTYIKVKSFVPGNSSFIVSSKYWLLFYWNVMNWNKYDYGIIRDNGDISPYLNLWSNFGAPLVLAPGANPRSALRYVIARARRFMMTTPFRSERRFTLLGLYETVETNGHGFMQQQAATLCSDESNIERFIISLGFRKQAYVGWRN